MKANTSASAHSTDFKRSVLGTGHWNHGAAGTTASVRQPGSCNSTQTALWSPPAGTIRVLNPSLSSLLSVQWGTADAEIKIPSVENTELKGSPFKAWSRSVYSRTCYAYCRGFLPG